MQIRSFLRSLSPRTRRLLVAAVPLSSLVISSMVVAGLTSLSYESPQATVRLCFGLPCPTGPTGVNGDVFELSALNWCRVSTGLASPNDTKIGLCVVEDDDTYVGFVDYQRNTASTLTTGSRVVVAGSGAVSMADIAGDGYESLYCDNNACWTLIESDKTDSSNQLGDDNCRSALYRTKNFDQSATGRLDFKSTAMSNSAHVTDAIQLDWNTGSQAGGDMPTNGCAVNYAQTQCNAAPNSAFIGGLQNWGCGEPGLFNNCNTDDDCAFYQHGEYSYGTSPTDKSLGYQFPLVCDDDTHQCEWPTGKMKKGANGLVLLKNGHLLVTLNAGPLGGGVVEFAPHTDLTPKGFSFSDADACNEPVDVFNGDVFTNKAHTSACAPSGATSSTYSQVAQWTEAGGTYWINGRAASTSATTWSAGPVGRFQADKACEYRRDFKTVHFAANGLTYDRDVKSLIMNSNSCRGVWEIKELPAPSTNFDGNTMGTYRVSRVVSTVNTPDDACLFDADCSSGEACINRFCLEQNPVGGGEVLLDRSSAGSTTVFPLVAHDGAGTDPDAPGGPTGCTINGLSCHKNDLFKLPGYIMPNPSTAAVDLCSAAECGNTAAQIGGGQTCACDFGCYERGDCCLNINAFCSFPSPAALNAGVESVSMRCSKDGDSTKSWGDDSHQQLGIGSTASDVLTPTDVNISFLSSSSRVVAYNNHRAFTLCGLTEEQKLYCVGDNTYGQTGRGNGGSDQNVALAVAWDTDGNSIPDTDMRDVVDYEMGPYHGCAIRGLSRAVWCWGRNDYGQLGIGSTAAAGGYVPKALEPVIDTNNKPLTNIVQVRTTNFGTCAANILGYVYCWGRDTDGELGNGSPLTASNKAVAVSGPGAGGRFEGFRELVMGYAFACVRTDDAGTSNDKVYCWGNNDQGQLGDGTTTDRSTPVPVKESSTVVFTGAKQIAAGAYHVCAIDLDTDNVNETVKCWGDDAYGQLGNGAGETDQLYASSTSDVADADDGTPIGVTNTTVGYEPRQLVAGNSFTCALLQTTSGNAQLFPSCWGDNSEGQIGNGTRTQQDVPEAGLSRTMCQ